MHTAADSDSNFIPCLIRLERRDCTQCYLCLRIKPPYLAVSVGHEFGTHGYDRHIEDLEGKHTLQIELI